MLWILLFSFAFGNPKSLPSAAPHITPTPKHTPTRGEQILNQPAKASLLGPKPALPLIRSTMAKQESFLRGEFDQLELQQKLSKEISDSIHQLAPLTGPQISAWMKSDGEIWWLYLERLSFDEATKSALDFSWKYRRDLFEVLRKKVLEVGPYCATAEGCDLGFPSAEVLAWLKRLEFRPPLDRLLTAEARTRNINAFRLIGVVQANPFRSVRDVREKLPSKLKADTAELDSFWTDQNAKDLHDFSNERDTLVKLMEGQK